MGLSQSDAEPLLPAMRHEPHRRPAEMLAVPRGVAGHRRRVRRLGPPAAGGASAGRATSEYRLASLLLFMTIFAVLAGIIAMDPGIGIVVAIVAVPVLLHACVATARRKKRVQSTSSGGVAGKDRVQTSPSRAWKAQAEPASPADLGHGRHRARGGWRRVFLLPARWPSIYQEAGTRSRRVASRPSWSAVP